MAKTTEELLSLGVGGFAGALWAKYPDNMIAGALTRKERTIDPATGLPTVQASDVSFWKKAPFWDIVSGVLVGGVGFYAPKLNDNLRLGLKAWAVYLVANGVTDMIADAFVPDAQKTYNGRPNALPLPTADVGVVVSPGPQSRALATRQGSCYQTSRAMAGPMARMQRLGRQSLTPRYGGVAEY